MTKQEIIALLAEYAGDIDEVVSEYPAIEIVDEAVPLGDGFDTCVVRDNTTGIFYKILYSLQSTPDEDYLLFEGLIQVAPKEVTVVSWATVH